jgi:hypothetical protein
MAMSDEPQVAQMNEKSALKSFLHLTLTHFHDEDPEPRKVCARFEIDPLQA